mgnify:CR=1 FL=1
MQKPRSHSVQQRRRWSDWSECSASCLKTRHRLNCDDILAQNSTQKVAAKSESTSLDKRDTSGGLGESEDELLLKADQIEEDDYADEGDEDEEKDSCDNVDPRKTYEEIGCIGGQCKYSGQAPSEQRQPMAAMSPRLKQHHRLKELMVSGRGQDPRLLSQGDKGEFWQRDETSCPLVSRVRLSTGSRCLATNYFGFGCLALMLEPESS